MLLSAILADVAAYLETDRAALIEDLLSRQGCNGVELFFDKTQGLPDFN